MNDARKARIAVVGAGALGGYVGARLAHTGQEVHFLVRSDYDAVLKNGWKIESAGEEPFTVRTEQVYRNSTAIGAVDVVVVALKTTNNSVLPELINPLLHEDTLLFSLQNGMGVTDSLEAQFPGQPVAAGLCYIAANRLGPGHIVNQAPRGGRMRIAPAAPENLPRTASLGKMIEESGIDCEVLEDLEEAIWRKLMWNVPFNGLPVAMGGCSSETIVGDEAFLEVARNLMEELRAAANARGGAIEQEFTEELIDYPLHLGPYQASTVVDFLAGRSLEVESIWEVPLRRGREAGVPMPHLATLHAVLKGIDDQRNRQA